MHMFWRKFVSCIIIPTIMVLGWVFSFGISLYFYRKANMILKPYPTILYILLANGIWNALCIRASVFFYLGKKTKVSFNIYPFLFGIIVLVGFVIFFAKLVDFVGMGTIFTIAFTAIFLSIDF